MKVLVTGAAHGIGLATARAFAREGASVVCVDIDEAALASACTTWATPVCSDVADLQRIVDAVGSEPIDILVNNVGVMDGRGAMELPVERFRSSLERNVTAAFALSQFVASGLIKQERSGAIFFMSSLHAQRIRMAPDYSVSKAAIEMLAKELAASLGPNGIRVNCIAPGAIDTWSDVIEEATEHRARSEAIIPMRRLGVPADIAELIVAIALQPAFGYVTGASLKVDGGLDTFNWLHHLYESPAEERDLY